jgi:hypothetical protein
MLVVDHARKKAYEAGAPVWYGPRQLALFHARSSRLPPSPPGVVQI